MFIGDVSGHGTPAAVLMAVTHSIAHTLGSDPTPPSKLLNFVNQNLRARYTNGNGTFVTAFYGIYDPTRRSLLYSSAGHCTPRLRRGDTILQLDAARQIPLGIEVDQPYLDGDQQFQPGDKLVMYTDGITETRDPAGELFGTDRLDRAILAAKGSAAEMTAQILETVARHANGRPSADDETLLVGHIS